MRTNEKLKSELVYKKGIFLYVVLIIYNFLLNCIRYEELSLFFYTFLTIRLILISKAA